jgi:hypothetical protein
VTPGRRDERARVRKSTAALATVVMCAFCVARGSAQTDAPPRVRATVFTEHLTIDGVLNEPAWAVAESVDQFLQADPVEGAPATLRTVVRALARTDAIVVGIVCEDPEPEGIVSFSVRRDAPLTSEDHIRIVVGPFLDGRSGYVFAVNPSGARYDGLINPGGESDNPDWRNAACQAVLIACRAE